MGSCHPHVWGYMWGYKIKYVGIFSKVIEKTKALPGKPVFQSLPDRAKYGTIVQLDQTEFGCPFDGHPAVIDVEFTVDILGMCAHRAQGDHEFAGDLRPR